METRSQAKQRRSEPDKFEKTVNLLLTQCRRRGMYQFELRVDKPFADPDARKNDPKTLRLPMINVKLREDKTRSRPDAELIQVVKGGEEKKDRLYIVIDAKFYSQCLSSTTIDKTLDDMKLRKARGLIICSEETQLSPSIDINLQKERGTIKIVKLKKLGSKLTEKDRHLQSIVPDQSMFMSEYLSKANLEIIGQKIDELIELHQEELKSEKLKAIYKVDPKQAKRKFVDDTHVSSQSTMLGSILSTQVTSLTEDSEILRDSQRHSKLKRTNSSSKLLDDLVGDLESLCLDKPAPAQILVQEKTIIKEEQKVPQRDSHPLFQGIQDLDSSDDEDYVPELKDKPIVVEEIKEQIPKWLLKKQANQEEDERKEVELDDRVSIIVRDFKNQNTKEGWLKVCQKYDLRLTKQGALDKRTKENKLILKALEEQFGKERVAEAQGVKPSLLIQQQAPPSQEEGKKEVFYKGLTIPINKNGRPNMCYKICKETFNTDEELAKFIKHFSKA